MATFLLKTEPNDYSFARLQKDNHCTWDGVSNAAALKHMRSMKKGDQVFIYHTGDEKRIVGLAKVSKGAYEDPKNPGLNAEGEPRTPVVDLAPVKPVPEPVTLAAIKADARFAEFALVRQARLSVMPVPAEIDAALREMAGL